MASVVKGRGWDVTDLIDQLVGDYLVEHKRWPTVILMGRAARTLLDVEAFRRFHPCLTYVERRGDLVLEYKERPILLVKDPYRIEVA